MANMVCDRLTWDSKRRAEYDKGERVDFGQNSLGSVLLDFTRPS